MTPAPIILFVYNRPMHTRLTVEALQHNELAAESDLFIYADGPKRAEHADGVREVREYIRTVDGFKSVTILERDENLGLAHSIIAGVTETVNRLGRIIVLEDDLVTSPYFLQFMNDALDMYMHDEKVVGISGYMFPFRTELPETFFMRGVNVWGWATWSRAWQLFEADGLKLLNEIRKRKITRRFDLDGSNLYTRMLKEQIIGKNDSWAIRWRASVFLADGMTFFPGKSLVRNIGFDATGVHCGMSNDYDVDISMIPTNVSRIPLEECGEASAALIHFYRSRQLSILDRVFLHLRRLLPKWRVSD